MFKRYQVYIFVGLFQIFLLLAVIFVALFFITQLFGILSYAGGLRLGLRDMLSVFFLTLPNFYFYFSFPVAMFTLIIFYNRFQSNNEFIILLTSGVKLSEILKPARLFIILIVLFSVYNSLYLLPISRYLTQKELNSVLSKNSLSMLSSPGLNIFKNDVVVLVKKNGNNNSILLYKEDKRNERDYIISSESFKISNNKLVLSNGVIIPEYSKNKSTSLIRYKKNIIDPMFLLSLNNRDSKNYKGYTVNELLEAMKKTDRKNLFDMYFVEINRRLLFSFVSLFIVWVSLIPFLTSVRYGGNNYYYLLPFLSLIIFYVFSSLGRNMIFRGDYTGIAVSWSTVLVFFAFSFFVRFKVKKKL